MKTRQGTNLKNLAFLHVVMFGVLKDQVQILRQLIEVFIMTVLGNMIYTFYVMVSTSYSMLVKEILC